MIKPPLSIALLEGLNSLEQLRLGLTAARRAFPFWQHAFPELESQAPLRKALAQVERLCAYGESAPDLKETAVAAYRAVSGCGLPPGDIHRSAGFAVAHLAMAAWLHEAGRLTRARRAVQNAIDHSEAIHAWARRSPELESALRLRVRESDRLEPI